MPKNPLPKFWTIEHKHIFHLKIINFRHKNNNDMLYIDLFG